MYKKLGYSILASSQWPKHTWLQQKPILDGLPFVLAWWLSSATKTRPDGALILAGVWPREWRVTHVEVVLSILDMRNISVMVMQQSRVIYGIPDLDMLSSLGVVICLASKKKRRGGNYRSIRHLNSQKRSLSKIFPRRVRTSGSRLEKIDRDTVAPGDQIQPGSGGLDLLQWAS